MGKLSYFAMANKDASIFYDSKSGLMVLDKEPGSVPTISAKSSRKVKDAIRGGFIKEISEEEFNKLIGKASESKSDQSDKEAEKVTTKIDFSHMNKNELYSYLKDNYEVDEDGLQEFKEMNKSEMIKYLEELEEQE